VPTTQETYFKKCRAAILGYYTGVSNSWQNMEGFPNLVTLPITSCDVIYGCHGDVMSL